MRDRQAQSQQQIRTKDNILYQYGDSPASIRDLVITVPRLPDAYVTCPANVADENASALMLAPTRCLDPRTPPQTQTLSAAMIPDPVVTSNQSPDYP